MNTEQLIATLSTQTPKRRPLPGAGAIAARAGALLLTYAAGAQLVLGMRPDLGMMWHQPLYALEIMLLALLAISALGAAVLLMYPDHYQRSALMPWPWRLLMMLAVLLLVPIAGTETAMPALSGAECALCISSVAALPAAGLFWLLRHGATTAPRAAGLMAALAAAAIGCLTLRLAEPTNDIAHVFVWHYVPTLGFALLGAALGRRLLKW